MKRETKNSIALAGTRDKAPKLFTNLRRSIPLITVMALMIGVLHQGWDRVGAQPDEPAPRFTKAPFIGKLVPKVPLGLRLEDRRQQESTVVLKMSGDPVAKVRAR